jgi:hypothetical protein
LYFSDAFTYTDDTHEYAGECLSKKEVKGRERTRIRAEYKTDANERPDVSALFLAMVSQYFMGTLTSA